MCAVRCHLTEIASWRMHLFVKRRFRSLMCALDCKRLPREAKHRHCSIIFRTFSFRHLSTGRLTPCQCLFADVKQLPGHAPPVRKPIHINSAIVAVKSQYFYNLLGENQHQAAVMRIRPEGGFCTTDVQLGCCQT